MRRYVNYRHLSLLVDTMTSQGYLMPASRHGINTSESTGPMMRSTFEQSFEMVMEAATCVGGLCTRVRPHAASTLCTCAVSEA